ncbi:F-box only protein 27-like [Budorcas taxicolor]|uniref:F-box only protein 27-like n=1 Tax=Budorcas taxicolor TaxID=37181 RepID=UPI0022843F11|nr:F-box only protein 27-like [Budorcas taxicolor]
MSYAGSPAAAAAAAGPGEETTGASASQGLPACVPASNPESEEAPGLSQLPIEMLLEVLSYLPTSVLLGQCRHVCRYWRYLVDTRAMWLSILPYSHAKLWPIFRSCLPRDDDDDPRPCLLGRFCERRPLGRNLYPNPHGIDAFLPWRTVNCRSWKKEESWKDGRRLVAWDSFQPFYRWTSLFLKDWGGRWWCYKKQVLDLEEEGLWPELLDSGKIEICVSARWADQEASVCLYELIVQLLDAKQAKLHHFSPRPIHQGTTSIPFKTDHMFCNLKKGVRFVSLEHWIWDMGFLPEDYGIIVPKASVIVQVCQL